jgi:hypothetical protein
LSALEKTSKSGGSHVPNPGQSTRDSSPVALNPACTESTIKKVSRSDVSFRASS